MQLIRTTSFIISSLATLSLVFTSCTIQPNAWKPAPAPKFTGVTALNEELTHSAKLSLLGNYGPEDIVFDSLGNLYCGVHAGENDFSDGRILKIDTTGRAEVFYDTKSWVAGLHFDALGNLIALSHREGLISISKDKKVTVLADKAENGDRFLIPNGLDIASNGTIYFSNTSQIQAYNVRYGRRIIMEMNPLGGLYSYTPATKKVSTLIKGTYFGNGVVLSQDESYLLMTETSRYRILKHWLRGPKTGTTEVFMDNLPGFPNGISIRPDGSYWLGFSTRRNAALDKIHNKPAMKKLVYALPDFLQPKADRFGMVMHVDSTGIIIKALYDPTGKIMSEAGAIKEHNGHLYMGGDVISHIGKYALRE